MFSFSAASVAILIVWRATGTLSLVASAVVRPGFVGSFSGWAHYLIPPVWLLCFLLGIPLNPSTFSCGELHCLCLFGSLRHFKMKIYSNRVS